MLSHFHTSGTAVGSFLGSSVQRHVNMLPKPGIKLLTFRLVDDPVYLFSCCHTSTFPKDTSVPVSCETKIHVYLFMLLSYDHLINIMCTIKFVVPNNNIFQTLPTHFLCPMLWFTLKHVYYFFHNAKDNEHYSLSAADSFLSCMFKLIKSKLMDNQVIKRLKCLIWYANCYWCAIPWGHVA